MNWKNRLTNYNFWISIFSAVLLILQALKIEFDIAYVNEIFTAVLGLLVVIGIISDPTKTMVKSNDTKKQSTEQENKNKETSKDAIKDSAEEKTLPITEKNETDNVGAKNDFQIILNKISNDLDEKIKELEKFNFQIAKETNEKIAISPAETKVKDLKQDAEIVAPAVAENDNPYIDVLN